MLTNEFTLRIYRVCIHHGVEAKTKNLNLSMAAPFIATEISYESKFYDDVENYLHSDGVLVFGRLCGHRERERQSERDRNGVIKLAGTDANIPKITEEYFI